MSLARSLLRGAWSALRSAAWQPAAPAGSAAATAGLRGLSSSGGAGGSSAAAAACRLFSSSSASSMSSSSSNSTALLGAAGLRHLLRCCSGSIGGSLAAAGGGGGGSGAAWALQQARARTNSSHLVPKFKGGKIKPYRWARAAAAALQALVGAAPGRVAAPASLLGAPLCSPAHRRRP